MRVGGVAVVKRKISGYPWFPPFDPSIRYPEYPFSAVSDSENQVYDMIRELLWELELDAENRGTSQWNPFKDFIKEGQTVVIKPNFVLDYNQIYNGRGALEAITTDGSVLRPIVDYAFKACGPSGKIIICDTPLQNEVSPNLFDNLVSFNGTKAMVEELRKRGVPVLLLDLRSHVRQTTRIGFWRTFRLPGDSRGYIIFDLDDDSAFSDCSHPERLETNDWENVAQYHSNGRHIYSISRTILSADAVINVPKLKVHKKTGLTVALKNIFGISNRKDWIPHWRRGVDNAPTNPSRLYDWLRSSYGNPLLRPLARLIIRKLHFRLNGYGNWPGNDTNWRAVVDLCRIFFYGDLEGRLCEDKQRHVLTIVDGIIAGEGLGPLGAKPRPFGAVIGGWDPVEVDIICSQLMQLDPRKVKLLVGALSSHRLPLTSCTLDDLEPKWELASLSEPFELPPGWESVRLAEFQR
jgi:uncharacterized protein (DUF362 family)